MEQKVWFRNLQKARETKNWTQVKLANEVEVSQQSITYYETGTRVPSLEVAERLSKVLGVSINYLLGDNDEFTKKYYELSRADKETINIMINRLYDKKENDKSE